MKVYFIIPALFIYVLTNAQQVNSVDSIKRNLLFINNQSPVKAGRNGTIRNGADSPPYVMDQCHKPGDFFVTSLTHKAIGLSNIFNLFTFESLLLPADEPFDGSIGILSDQNILLQPLEDSVFYYSKDGWAYYGLRSESQDLYHCGGGNQSAFFMGTHLWHLNGNTQPQVIYENIQYTCADLVVDQLERAWVLTGTHWPVSDTLRVIDSTGMQICAFPLKEPINTLNAYGMMMNQNKIWLGIGRFNTIFPGKLLPLDIIDNEVIPGTPLDFPDLNYSDLESCEVGLPANSDCIPTTSISSWKKHPFVQVFPNPGNDWIQVRTEILPDKIKLVSTAGILLKQILPGNLITEINIESLPPGLYFLHVQSDSRLTVIKLMKI